ncbi:MAG: N-acetylmuramic acid 6-phosphate etherase [Rhodobacter sp.]|uniref:N-acetylmuramic acid 6-phosphate etherase n=1 Tax=Pararhodobacter sp. TaxID=2127056 RepID=UPI001DEE6ADB|nr:N-acetylmuramic acid 6-phosphate etherase [Pararhodobacter sp.]MCB1344541.1 N-acetylmuramic acid 6-phosphate etherase [Paracoccaceae bacterium]MCC0073142.1 N-acetylmuramic acid 6-phosphate etherase [Rhodobacter sp.]HPD91139.1 N-acetylmuramic acid 6-phosphate etherase [Pararhodobacter sp.]
MSSTEQAAPRFDGLETWPTRDLAAALLETQLAAAAAAAATAETLAQAIDAAAQRLAAGGRLIYLGAGTSGRLAVLDAAELPPTFDWPRDRALALMAGGDAALVHAIEGAEDDAPAAVAALTAAALSPRDVVIGVAASGRTPYTRAGLAHARATGALAIGLFNAPDAPMRADCDLALVADTGAEIIAGSTRMKAGTAQKVLLNSLSTGIMVRLGHVWRGRMVEMRPTNAKLHARAVAMVADLASCPTEQARAALATGGTIKTALAMVLLDLDAETARARLAAVGGQLARVL